VVLLALMTQKPSTPAAPPPAAANTVLANAAPANSADATPPPAPAAPATPPAVGAPVGNGSELTPVNAGNPAGMTNYETMLSPNGPPATLQGATVISTAQLIQNMRERDAGTNSFWLIDARGCTTEPTIATSICLDPNNLQSLEAKVPDKATQVVIYCHDGSCPMSYDLASEAVGAGYTNIYWYRGGINAWMAAGEPTVNQNDNDPD
jgi:rhodanese-related sulfurtransferase